MCRLSSDSPMFPSSRMMKFSDDTELLLDLLSLEKLFRIGLPEGELESVSAPDSEIDIDSFDPEPFIFFFLDFFLYREGSVLDLTAFSKAAIVIAFISSTVNFA